MAPIDCISNPYLKGYEESKQEVLMLMGFGDVNTELMGFGCVHAELIGCGDVNAVPEDFGYILRQRETRESPVNITQVCCL